MIREIHLIHHSHTDLGYTDAPEQAFEIQYAGLRRALDMAEVAGSDADSCFRWTCESLGIVAKYLQRHPEDETRMERLVAAGRVEVNALPWNLTPALIAEEWQALRAHYASLRKRFAARVAMQCDINGLSWGAIPGLFADGVQAIWFAMNGFSGGSPLPVPTPAWWEGPDGSRILVWAGFGYGDGHSWFHDRGWRVGPVPEAHDIWFHRPDPSDEWLATSEGLASAHRHLTHRINERLAAYPYGALPLQTTDQWRIDNDPPCEHLGAFIAAWNAAGLQPRLVFSTPSRFLEVLRRDPAFDPPVVRGDWTDWWGDGSPSMPRELAWGQRAKVLLASLPNLAQRLGESVPDLGDAWEAAFESTEHTFGGYDSVARPWRLRSDAGWHHKALLFNRALQGARDAECALLRTARDHAPVARATGVAVANAGDDDGGWIELGLQRWPVEPRALRDAEGHTYPLEIEWQQEWSGPRADAPTPAEVPGDIWPTQPVRGRAWLPCPPGEIRRFTVAADASPEGPRAPEQGEDATWRWRWDGGVLRSLLHRPTGVELLDAQATHPFGALIWERYEAPRAWELVMARDRRLAEVRRLSTPVPEEWTALPSHYGPHWRWRRSHEAWRGAEQSLRLLPDGAVELATRTWVKECLQPAGLWLSVPLGPTDAEPVYDSLGYPTRVGADQMPGSCGETVGYLRLVGARRAGLAAWVDCTDTPIVSPGGLHARTGRKAARPERPHWYPCLLASWWFTNFPHIRPTCIEVRHVLRAGTDWPACAAKPLWAYPC